MMSKKNSSFFCGQELDHCSGNPKRGPYALCCASLVLLAAGLLISGCGVSASSPGSVQAAAANKTTPPISWATPAAITYGTALSSAQLDATSSVPGTFAYSPAAGTVPPVGTDTLSVTFTPSDPTAYNTATASVSLVVEETDPPTKTNPVITWPTPAAITYGTALSSAQLDATASVPGTFAYSPAAGTVPAVGTDTLKVTFTPSNTTDYNTASASVPLVVEAATTTTKTSPTVTWPTPAAITYGTALSSKQLDATASVSGTFAYSPAAGTVPPVGTDTLKVTFTPSDTTDYNTATASVSLVVYATTTTKTTPTITWPTPAAITYGTALSSAQLDATASVPGTFAYSPAAGTVPAVGTDTLNVIFTPSNKARYNTASASVSLVVNAATTKTTPTITWSTPAAITYGTALSATQLDATASVPGTFVYSPAAGTKPAVGTDTLTVTFTPTNTTEYNNATASVSLVVNAATTKTTPTITWPTPAAITYGTALSATQLDATASVPGTFVYSPAAGTVPAVGTDTLSVTFTPTNTTEYNNATASVSLVVNASTTKTTPTITWPTPAAITYGTALSATQLDATASVPGTFVYSPAAGTVPAVGTDTLSVTFTPTNTTEYNNATASVLLVVNSSSGTPTGTALNDCGDLTKSGTYYLTQNVNSAGTCFFIDADNITLNLNGYTITYGTGGGSAGTPGILLADTWYSPAPSYSLAQTGSTNTHGGFVLYGGTLTEASNAAIQSRGIWVGQSNDISPAPVIHDMVINTYTQDAEPIFGTISTSGWQIYNNTLNWACVSTYPATGTVCDSSRYSLFGYALWLADDPNGPGAVPDQIYNNKILNAPQGGIFDEHQNAQIHNNDITFDSFFTNDYCIAVLSGNGQVINMNNCHPTSGRGIDDEAENVQITNNTINVTELPQNSEYGGCELAGADGIRVRDNLFEGNPTPAVNVTVSGNTITATATPCQANGLRLTGLLPGDTVTFANNTVTTTSSNPQGLYNTDDYAISFDADDQAPLTFTANTLQSSRAWVEVDWDGANQTIQTGQNWVGSPLYFVDDENGYNEGGTTFSQSLTVDNPTGGTIHCGTWAAGTVEVGPTTVTCN
jgi:hypothetical protein